MLRWNPSDKLKITRTSFGKIFTPKISEAQQADSEPLTIRVYRGDEACARANRKQGQQAAAKRSARPLEAAA